MMTVNDFIHKHNLKNKATSIIKIYQVLSSLSLSDSGIYLKVSPFEIDIGVVNLRPSEGTHWVAYINEKFFHSNDCAPSQKLSKFVRKGNGQFHFLNEKYKV